MTNILYYLYERNRVALVYKCFLKESYDKRDLIKLSLHIRFLYAFSALHCNFL